MLDPPAAFGQDPRRLLQCAVFHSATLSALLISALSERCETPKAAKREASYMCCKLLRHAGALDDHLLPILTFATPEEVHDEQGRVIGSKKRQIGCVVPWLISVRSILTTGTQVRKKARGPVDRPSALLGDRKSVV